MPVLSKRAIADVLNRILARSDMVLSRRSDLWHAINQLGRQPAPHPGPQAFRTPIFRSFGPDDALANFDVAVVVPTTLRPTIVDALHSVFAQDFRGKVQTLIGIDKPLGDVSLVEDICRCRPPNHTVMLFDPGYSTSVRHGGLHPSWDGGVLRTVLTYLAASRRVAYLDDDNWWGPEHLTGLVAALEGHDWAWSLRWYVHPGSRHVICEDEWESNGPGTGTQPGGWVDTNCLAVDKLECEALLRWWSIPSRNSPRGTSADRNVFRLLVSEFRGRCSGLRTTYYALNEADVDNDQPIARIGEERYRAAGRPPDAKS